MTAIGPGVVSMIETTASSVEIELQRFFAASRLRASDYGEHYSALWDSLAQASAGGKRVRPVLVLAAYSGFGGRNVELVTPVAVCFELLHTAFTIHDDVIDRDLRRRGNPNVAGTFSDRAVRNGANAGQASVWATAAAILAGDLALSEAHRLLAMLPVDPALRAGLLDLLDRSVFVSAAGELADVTSTVSTVPVTLDAVLSTLEFKTAIYSFEAPLQAGASLAGASEDALETLGRFGRLIGVAFQLVDDYLGVFGDPQLTGKSVLADLREGKQTALIAYARTTPAWPEIAPFVGKPDLTEEEAAFVRQRLDDCGAVDRADELTAGFTVRALSAIDSPLIPATLRHSLRELAATAVVRQR